MRGEKLYEGKAKAMYAHADNKGWCVQVFKDDISAFDGVKRDVIVDKGVFNCTISSKLFEYLEEHGVVTHYVEQSAPNEMIVRRLDMLRVEVVVRNVMAGSFCKRYGVEQGTPLAFPLVEFFLKDDELHDPLITKEGALALGLATRDDLEFLEEQALNVNTLLNEFFTPRGITLVDFKLEFGRSRRGTLVLGDEVSPDSCRLWETGTNKKLDKDIYRFDLGDVHDAYQEMMQLVTT